MITHSLYNTEIEVYIYLGLNLFKITLSTASETPVNRSLIFTYNDCVFTIFEVIS